MIPALRLAHLAHAATLLHAATDAATLATDGYEKLPAFDERHASAKILFALLGEAAAELQDLRRRVTTTPTHT